MTPADHAFTGTLALLQILTRALVAKGVIEKIDLLAELSRVHQNLPKPVVLSLQELIQALPDQ